MKLATFAWSWTVSVPDDFNEEDNTHFSNARHSAFLNVQERDGEITDIIPEDYGPKTPCEN